MIITSSRLDVCNSMKTTKNIDVKVLSKNDSLELFQQEVGDVDSIALHKMSEKIVNESRGLPLAIVTHARALRKKDKSVWIDAISQLRKSMYGVCLVSRRSQSHHGCTGRVRDGGGFFGEVETLSKARGNLHMMVATLVSSGLLVKGDDEGYVMMHDIVRDVAIPSV
ncbi:hypothetical protein GIB67_030210 [Kingdonia uniflora]|uniref:Uncharacterized protein n=1 Tax=Kingdonia uniflora TaxID=39325 RepID=A0A7J7MN05_9MAGN|nr:hypothetical protein GIB67_030210 [Kingdonia uniflora]